MYEVTYAALAELFQKERALVQTASPADLHYRAINGAKHPKQVNHRWVSTSLAPKSGRMSYYGSRSLRVRARVALVFDFDRCDIAGHSKAKPKYWCYPTGYYAKLNYNTTLNGIPKRSKHPFESVYTKSRYDMGIDTSIDDLRAANQLAAYPMYNEVYIKVPAASGILSYANNTFSRVMAFSLSLTLRAKHVVLPVGVVTRDGVKQCTEKMFFDDLNKLSVEELAVLVRSYSKYLKGALAALPKERTTFLRALFTLKEGGRLTSADISVLDREQKKVLIQFASLHNVGLGVVKQLVGFSPDLPGEILSCFKNNEVGQFCLLSFLDQRVIGKDFISVSLEARERLSPRKISSSFFRMFKPAERKWVAFDERCDRATSPEGLLRVALSASRGFKDSARRRGVVYEMLGLPNQLPLGLLKSVAATYLSSSEADVIARRNTS